MVERSNNTVQIRSEADIITVRKVVREASQAMGFNITDITRIVTATSELTRNVYLYAGEGSMHWQEIRQGLKTGIELQFKDDGPGIEDIEQAMEPGFTSGGGLGLGLPGAKRLMDEMEIDSQVNKGTLVIIRKWMR